MLSWAVLLLCIFANTVLFRKLPFIEGVVTVIHVLGFIGFVIVLWYVRPENLVSRGETSADHRNANRP